MKTKIIFILNILVIIFCASVIYFYFTDTYEISTKNMRKCITLFITYLGGIIWYFIQICLAKRSYKTLYKDFLESAFCTDRSSFRKLMTYIWFYNQNRFSEAVRGLNHLLLRCKTVSDNTAVLMFLALCHSENKQPDLAIHCYRQLLATDTMNSVAWSNLGTVYINTGQLEEAFSALKQALLYNPENDLANYNMANYYYTRKEYEETIKYALKTLAINPDMHNAIRLISIAYVDLGDVENAKKYCRQYGSLRNDIRPLSAYIEEHFPGSTK